LRTTTNSKGPLLHQRRGPSGHYDQQEQPEEKRAKGKGHGLTFSFILQQQWEISRRYDMLATPSLTRLTNKGQTLFYDNATGANATTITNRQLLITDYESEKKTGQMPGL